MKTLEDLTQGTLIGHYAVRVYSIILLMVGIILLTISLLTPNPDASITPKQIAQFYNIPLNGAERVVCYQGILHYPNKGLFPGLLAYQPSISCTEQELSALKEKPTQTPIKLALLLMGAGLILLWAWYSESKKTSTAELN
jgi:hypothetical protein